MTEGRALFLANAHNFSTLQVADFELSTEEMASIMALNKNYRIFADQAMPDG